MTEEEKLLVKPVNPPATWWLKAELIDEVGNVFRKGKYVGTKEELNITDAPPPTVEDKIEPEKVAKEVKPKSESKPNSDEVLLAMMEQNKLLVKLVEKMASGDKQSLGKDIAEAMASVNNNQSNRRSARRLEEIDTNDILEHPIYFSAHSSGYVVVNYYGENGQVVLPPYGGIFEFKLAGVKKVKNDKDEQVHCLCQCKIRSKREAEFLRNHPHYGWAFFENSREALNIDNTTVQRAAELWNKVSDWDKAQVMEAARLRPDMKDKLGWEIFRLRKALAISMAEEIIKGDEKAAMEKANEMRVASLMKQ